MYDYCENLENPLCSSHPGYLSHTNSLSLSLSLYVLQGSLWPRLFCGLMPTRECRSYLNFLLLTEFFYNFLLDKKSTKQQSLKEFLGRTTVLKLTNLKRSKMCKKFLPTSFEILTNSLLASCQLLNELFINLWYN